MRAESSDQAMEQAVSESSEDDGTYWGEIPGLQGVWARDTTPEGCRRDLREGRSDWIALHVRVGLSLPILVSSGARGYEVPAVSSMAALPVLTWKRDKCSWPSPTAVCVTVSFSKCAARADPTALSPIRLDTKAQERCGQWAWSAVGSGGVHVHIAKQRMVLDDAMPSRMTATVLGLAAEIAREFIALRTREALAKRKADGKRYGGAPRRRRA